MLHFENTLLNHPKLRKNIYYIFGSINCNFETIIDCMLLFQRNIAHFKQNFYVIVRSLEAHLNYKILLDNLKIDILSIASKD